MTFNSASDAEFAPVASPLVSETSKSLSDGETTPLVNNSNFSAPDGRVEKKKTSNKQVVVVVVLLVLVFLVAAAGIAGIAYWLCSCCSHKSGKKSDDDKGACQPAKIQAQCPTVVDALTQRYFNYLKDSQMGGQAAYKYSGLFAHTFDYDVGGTWNNRASAEQLQANPDKCPNFSDSDSKSVEVASVPNWCPTNRTLELDTDDVPQQGKSSFRGKTLDTVLDFNMKHMSVTYLRADFFSDLYVDQSFAGFFLDNTKLSSMEAGDSRAVYCAYLVDGESDNRKLCGCGAPIKSNHDMRSNHRSECTAKNITDYIASPDGQKDDVISEDQWNQSFVAGLRKKAPTDKDASPWNEVAIGNFEGVAHKDVPVEMFFYLDNPKTTDNDLLRARSTAEQYCSAVHTERAPAPVVKFNNSVLLEAYHLVQAAKGAAVDPAKLSKPLFECDSAWNTLGSGQ